jgi:CRP/FNR family cyclic AMP-dependent transcriptional regulator
MTASLPRESEPFEALEPQELASFLAEAHLQRYPAGSIIFSPEDASTERLYILKQGRIDRYRLTAGGKRLVTRRILPGAVFGVMGLLGRSMQGNFAQADEDSLVYVITREDVLALLERRPNLTLRMLEIVGNRLRLLEERLLEAVYSPVIVRLASFLLSNIDSTSGELPEITHEEIGNTIGAVRQTVTETLGVMKKQGLVKTGQKRIRIIDRRGIQRIVEGSEH